MAELDKSELTPTQRSILYHLVYRPDLTHQDIADEVGCSRQHVWKLVAKNETFKKHYDRELEIQREMVRKDFLKNVSAVHEKLLRVIMSDFTEDKNVINASKWYLEQVLGKATNKHEIESNTTITNNIKEDDILAVFDELEEEKEEEED